MQNSLIDTLDKLTFPADLETRWNAATEVANSLGVKSILVANANGKKSDFGWINTNMPNGWMEQYIHENYMEIDAILDGLLGDQNTIQWDVGKLHRDDASSQKVFELDQGLRHFGFGMLFGNRFCAPDEYGTYVTLGFAQNMESRVSDFDMNLKLFAAVLAANIQAPLATQANQFFTGSSLSLTERQKDVLCFLANGYQTARIAEKLGVTEATVTFHMANARKALGAQTREHALALALKYELISP